MSTPWQQYHWISVSPAAKAWREEHDIPQFPPALRNYKRADWRTELAARMALDDAWNWLGMQGLYGPPDPQRSARNAILVQAIEAHPAREALRRATHAIGRGLAASLMRRKRGAAVSGQHASA